VTKSIIAALGLFATLFVVTPSPAVAAEASFAAASRGCVTRAEFRRVKHGMKKSRVHRIFDTSGRFADGGAGGYSRVYSSCDFRHAAFVEYGARRGPDRATGWKRWTGAS
jgi:hypothetical protein